MIYDTIIPVLLGILGFAAVVSCSVLGYQIVKSADEPQERAQKVHNLKIILLGIGVAFVILMLIKPIINIIENYL